MTSQYPYAKTAGHRIASELNELRDLTGTDKALLLSLPTWVVDAIKDGTYDNALRAFLQGDLVVA